MTVMLTLGLTATCMKAFTCWGFLVILFHVIYFVYIHPKSCWFCPFVTCALLLQAALTAVWMWAYAYFSYPAVLFGILLAGSGAASYLLYRQRLRLVNMVTQRHLVPVLYRKFVRALLAKQLVPGDVIVVQRGKAACDMVLLRGSCLVEESMLSGEVWASKVLHFVFNFFALWGPFVWAHERLDELWTRPAVDIVALLPIFLTQNSTASCLTYQ